MFCYWPGSSGDNKGTIVESSGGYKPLKYYCGGSITATPKPQIPWRQQIVQAETELQLPKPLLPVLDHGRPQQWTCVRMHAWDVLHRTHTVPTRQCTDRDGRHESTEFVEKLGPMDVALAAVSRWPAVKIPVLWHPRTTCHTLERDRLRFPPHFRPMHLQPGQSGMHCWCSQRIYPARLPRSNTRQWAW